MLDIKTQSSVRFTTYLDCVLKFDISSVPHLLHHILNRIQLHVSTLTILYSNLQFTFSEPWNATGLRQCVVHCDMDVTCAAVETNLAHLKTTRL